jgi:cellulose 1,4-beta-cellobiosidase
MHCKAPQNPKIILTIMYRFLTVASSLLAIVQGQLVGTQTTETHPGMTWQQCTAKGSCTTKNGKVVVDSSKSKVV